MPVGWPTQFVWILRSDMMGGRDPLAMPQGNYRNALTRRWAMKKMRFLPVLLLFVSPSFGQSYSSYAFGKKYDFQITPEMLAKSSWDGKTDSPPLPVGKAIRLANALKNKLVKDSKDFKWHLISATLNNNWLSGSDAGTKWWWSINYEAHVQMGMSTGIPDHLMVTVLMDGTVVEPKITNALWPN
jgi:hypothetical protein